jgi:hypothetical protein
MTDNVLKAVRIATMLLVAVFLGLTAPAQDAKPPEQAGEKPPTEQPKAYIFVADINPPWYSTLLRGAFGEVDPYKQIQPMIDEQKAKLTKMGYKVVTVDVVVEHEFKKALQDPATQAVVWFGHGDEGVPGSLYTLQDNSERVITPQTIKEWAQETLPKQGEGESGPPIDETKTRDDAHFKLKYAHFQTCYGMKNNDLADALMDDDGAFHGYEDKAFFENTAKQAATIRGKAVRDPKDVPKVETAENEFFSFRAPAGWKVSYGDNDTQKRYVFLIKEVKKEGEEGVITVTYGVRLTIGEIIGADYFKPELVKHRDGEMAQDEKWDFSGGEDKRVFSKFARVVCGETAPGYVKKVTKKVGEDKTETNVTEKTYFKSGTRYYFIEFSYRSDFREATYGGYLQVLDTLKVK